VETLLIASFITIIFFGAVVFFGAPYLPTLNKQTKEALILLNLKKGQTLLELGSGDGRVLRAAAKQGIKCVGYELNPALVLWSKLRCWRYRNLVSVKWANYWNVDWPKSDGMYVFLLQKYMRKLDNKIMHYNDKSKPYKLVSNTFLIPDKKPQKTKTGLALYVYHK